MFKGYLPGGRLPRHPALHSMADLPLNFACSRIRLFVGSARGCDPSDKYDIESGGRST